MLSVRGTFKYRKKKHLKLMKRNRYTMQKVNLRWLEL